MNLIRHGDYIARVVYDEDIDTFFGEVINTGDVITFYGRSVDELHRKMAVSIEAHLDACRAKGVEPIGRALSLRPMPYSGRFNVRLSPDETSCVKVPLCTRMAGGGGRAQGRFTPALPVACGDP